MIYLASPYSHADPEVERQRATCARIATVNLLRLSIPTYSPIVYGRALLDHAPDMSGDWATWQTLDAPQLAASALILVLCLPGWDDSQGVLHELALAQRLDKPIRYLASVRRVGTEHWSAAPLATCLEEAPCP